MSKQNNVDIEVGTILRLVSMVNGNNILPHAGGILDQNAMFVHFYYYTTELQRTREELDKKQEEARNRSRTARR
jgi:hypothetical protein